HHFKKYAESHHCHSHFHCGRRKFTTGTIKPNRTTTRATPIAITTTAAAKPTATTVRNPKPYRTTSNPYHQHNHLRFSCRRLLCKCYLWSTLSIDIILFFAAIIGAIFYVLYHPQRPRFSIYSLKISNFSLTTTPDDITQRSINFKLILYTLTALENEVILASGSFNGISSSPKNITIMHFILLTGSQVLDIDSVTSLQSDLQRKGWLPVTILIDTMIRVKMDKLKSKRVGIRVTCEGVYGQTPTGEVPAVCLSLKSDNN
ncbi:NDR1/HIN1-like protein 13, partial [Nicotiana tabacum]